MKYWRSGWWENAKERIVKTKTRQALGKSGRWLFLFMLMAQNWLCIYSAAEGVPKRTEMTKIWQHQEVQVKGEQMGREIPLWWKKSKGEGRAEMTRCTLLNGSAWSTERKYIRRFEGRCDIFFGMENRLRKEEMEEQFNHGGEGRMEVCG